MVALTARNIAHEAIYVRRTGMRGMMLKGGLSKIVSRHSFHQNTPYSDQKGSRHGTGMGGDMVTYGRDILQSERPGIALAGRSGNGLYLAGTTGKGLTLAGTGLTLAGTGFLSTLKNIGSKIIRGLTGKTIKKLVQTQAPRLVKQFAPQITKFVASQTDPLIQKHLSPELATLAKGARDALVEKGLAKASGQGLYLAGTTGGRYKKGSGMALENYGATPAQIQEIEMDGKLQDGTRVSLDRHSTNILNGIMTLKNPNIKPKPYKPDTRHINLGKGLAFL